MCTKPKVGIVTHMKQSGRNCGLPSWLNPKNPHYLHLFYTVLMVKAHKFMEPLLFLTSHFSQKLIFDFETQNSYLTFSVDYFAHVGFFKFLIFIPFRFLRSTAQQKSKFQIDLFQQF